MDSEDRIQAQCYQWFWNTYPRYRRLLFHIPNGGKRTKVEAARFKTIGVVAGVPDLFLALASNESHGLFIEMKRTGGIPKPGNKLTAHDLRQSEVMANFTDHGYQCVYCDSLEMFQKLITIYLNGKS